MFRPFAIAVALTLAAGPALSQSVAGPYLAGRSAQMQDDFVASESYLTRAMRNDPSNLQVMEALIGARISLKDLDGAATVARDLAENTDPTQIAALALIGETAARGDWQALLGQLDSGVSVGPLFDDLARGWTLVGLERSDDAMAAFDKVIEDQSVTAYGIYHKALALGALGRYEEASETLLAQDDLRLTRRGAKAKAQILSQVGRTEDALETLEPGRNMDAILDNTRSALTAGETLDFTVAPDAQAGMAEIAFDIANTVVGETAPSYALLYSRIAEILRPGHVEATLLSSLLLEEMERYGLAVDNYASIPPDNPAYVTASIGRAEAMRAAGRTEAGIEALRGLAQSHPDVPLVHVTLGDALREEKQFAEARDAYDAALALFEEPSEAQWIIYFARAIAHERTDNWPAAEADFETALELNPNQPQVLNYLGYSLIERRERLDEALDMIELAVAVSPNSGYIVDSLGWALYRLGRYSEAVEPMERAVALMPVDPVVNDHLGDVLWAVGRELEARFQWQRALSFIDNDTSEEVDPDRIRKKLEVGLDQVLMDEGESPLIADGG